MTVLHVSRGERFLDVHEVVEASELGEPEQPRYQHDVMFGHGAMDRRCAGALYRR